MLTDRLYRALGRFPAARSQFKRVVRRLPHRSRMVERLGQRLIVDPSELSGFYLYYEREYDDSLFAFLDTMVSKYGCALDVGANMGIYTCYFAARVPKVLAFEPDKDLCVRIRANLALNNLSNVTLHEACVGLTSGIVTFYPASQTNNGVGSIIGTSGRSVECRSVCLDDILPVVRTEPCLIKMDIEGAEWLALQGARRALSEPGPAVDILLEVHPPQLERLGVSVERLRGLFLDLGYSLFGITSEGLVKLDNSDRAQRFWWATRQATAG